MFVRLYLPSVLFSEYNRYLNFDKALVSIVENKITNLLYIFFYLRTSYYLSANNCLISFSHGAMTTLSICCNNDKHFFQGDIL